MQHMKPSVNAIFCQICANLEQSRGHKGRLGSQLLGWPHHAIKRAVFAHGTHHTMNRKQLLDSTDAQTKSQVQGRRCRTVSNRDGKSVLCAQHLEEGEGSVAGHSLFHVLKGPGQQEAQLGVAGLASLALPHQAGQQLQAVLPQGVACSGHALQQLRHCLACRQRVLCQPCTRHGRSVSARVKPKGVQAPLGVCLSWPCSITSFVTAFPTAKKVLCQSCRHDGRSTPFAHQLQRSEEASPGTLSSNDTALPGL